MHPRSWLPFLIIILSLGVLLQLTWLIYLAIVILALIGFSQWWVRQSLKQVRFQRRIRYRRGFPGQTSPVTLEIENNKRLPLPWLKLTDPWPYAVSPLDGEILTPSHQSDYGLMAHYFSLRSHQHSQRNLEIEFKKRGVYPVGPSYIESTDLFGMYEQSAELNNSELLTVFPELLEAKQLGLPAHHPFGIRSSRRRIFDDPSRTMGVREYHPEDDIRRIHWPATAHTGTLQVREYEPATAQVMMICMNVATTDSPWLTDYPALLEQVIRVCATLAYDSFQHGYAVGVISNSCLAHSDQPFRVPPGRSPGQLATLLQTLAGATSYFSGPFEPLLLKSMGSLPIGATLAVVTGIVPESLVETLLRLRKHQAHTTLISLAKEAPPFIPGIRCIHLPFTEVESV